MAGPFGVELPADLGQSPEPSSPPSDISGSAPEGAAPEGTVSSKAPGTETPAGTEKPSLADLDKLERFRFEGREWKREELRRAILRQEDYTRKTQELAETRKYWDNFEADLQTLQREPHRLADFKRIYPKEFVERAERALEHLKGNRSPESQSSQTQPRDPEFEALKSEFQQIKEEREQAQIQAIQSWLDTQHSTLQKKYPDAIPELVDARASAAAAKGTKITAEVLEKLYKTHDSEIKARFAATYKGKVDRQLSAGKEGRDVGPGGGVPAEGPKRPKNLKEAKAAMLADLAASAQ